MISSSKTQATLLLVLVLGILLASHAHAFLKVGKRRLELLKELRELFQDKNDPDLRNIWEKSWSKEKLKPKIERIPELIRDETPDKQVIYLFFPKRVFSAQRSVCHCCVACATDDLCTRIKVPATIGLLKKPLSIC